MTCGVFFFFAARRQGKFNPTSNLSATSLYFCSTHLSQRILTGSPLSSTTRQLFYCCTNILPAPTSSNHPSPSPCLPRPSYHSATDSWDTHRKRCLARKECVVLQPSVMILTQ